MSAPTQAAPARPNPTAYAWLSVATAVGTLALKAVAAWATGSVSLLSDALESIVNLVAAALAVVALRLAARPADSAHPHGYEKVEYFSSGFEGALILVAAAGIAVEAIPRLLSPRPIESVSVGLLFSGIACVANLVVARLLLRVGRQTRSIALEADGHHLMSDVWTSVGVLGAIVAVHFTGLTILDPIAALVVAANIVRIAGPLVVRSFRGLMDASLPADELDPIRAALVHIKSTYPVEIHALRTRQAGARRFVELHVLVPGDWTVARGHDLCEEVEHRIRALAPRTTVTTHLEPLEDPRAFGDENLDRAEG